MFAVTRGQDEQITGTFGECMKYIEFVYGDWELWERTVRKVTMDESIRYTLWKVVSSDNSRRLDSRVF